MKIIELDLDKYKMSEEVLNFLRSQDVSNGDVVKMTVTFDTEDGLDIEALKKVLEDEFGVQVEIELKDEGDVIDYENADLLEPGATYKLQKRT